MLQTRAVLQWFAAMASRLGPQRIEPFLQCMVTPLLKITEGSAAKLVPGKSPCIKLSESTISIAKANPDVTLLSM